MTDAATPSRSDLLRKRRTQTTQERSSRVTTRSAAPVKSQPVTQRRATAPSTTRNYRTIPVAQKSRSNPRRQYYYTVGTTGAEIRLPAIPAVKFGPRLLSGILTLLLFIALFTLVKSSTFQVGQITVNGLQRVSSEEIADALDMEGEAIFAFNQREAYSKLSTAFPELDNLSIMIGMPASITVSATERIPILTWQYEDQSVWMDSQGVIFPARGTVEGLPVVAADAEPPLEPLAVPVAEDGEKVAETPMPEISGTVMGRKIDPRVLDVTLKMLPQIPAEGTLIYSRYSGLGWGDPSGWQVFIGRTLEDIDMKMVEYQAIVSYLGSQGVKPSVISVESIHAPFFRTEQ